MIELTRLNGHTLFVNCDLLKFGEASPDTVLTLLTGEKIVVRETCEEVMTKSLKYRASILEAAWPGTAGALAPVMQQWARMMEEKKNEE
jgi:flagellar protein FlbD